MGKAVNLKYDRFTTDCENGFTYFRVELIRDEFPFDHVSSHSVVISEITNRPRTKRSSSYIPSMTRRTSSIARCPFASSTNIVERITPVSNSSGELNFSTMTLFPMLSSLNLKKSCCLKSLSQKMVKNQKEARLTPNQLHFA